jgi:hypothetical protein
MDNSLEMESTSIFDHPEVQTSMGLLLHGLGEESDRGAVLIAAAEVDNHLRRLFECIAHPDIGKNDLKKLFANSGPLSSLSARSDIALLTRVISKSLHEAIRQLRQLRNSVAHSPTVFRLSDQQAHVRKIFDVGEGAAEWINRGIVHFLWDSFLNHALTIPSPSNAEAPAFADARAVMDYVKNRPDLTSLLDEKRPRLELALGTTLLCGLIVAHRETEVRRLSKNKERIRSEGTV